MENTDKNSITPEVFYNSISEGVDWQIDSKDVKRLVFSMLKLVISELRNGKEITIPDFGTFYVNKRAARKIRNVNSGEMVNIPPSPEVKFKPDIKLKKYFQLLGR